MFRWTYCFRASGAGGLYHGGSPWQNKSIYLTAGLKRRGGAEVPLHPLRTVRELPSGPTSGSFTISQQAVH